MSGGDSENDLSGLRFEPEPPATGRRGPGRRLETPGGRADRAVDPVEMLDDDAIEIGAEDLDRELADGPAFVADDGGPPFLIDDDLFSPDGDGLHDPGTGPADWADPWTAVVEEQSGPAFTYAGEEPGTTGGGSVIDRDDEVPERYWAPEVAGLGRRALALLVDQSLLTAALGVFFLGALVALRLNGIEAELLLGAAGLRASALPFALLAALLSIAYYGYFHGSAGSTPGKALVGVEVRTVAGGALTWGRVLLRWLGAALGLACAGVGIFWALFEPRRRGWADLLSGTVIARARRGKAAAASPR